MAVSDTGRRQGKVSNVQSDINVTPMADIMLVLLIIFMITTPLLQTGVSVNLPKARNPMDKPEADSESATIVALTREGRIYMNRVQITRAELEQQLRDRFVDAAPSDKLVFIKADNAVNYGHVVEIVDLVRDSGVEAIALLTDKIEAKQ